MARNVQTAARRHQTAAERREVHVQLVNACYGKRYRELVRSRRTYGGVHVTTQSR